MKDRREDIYLKTWEEPLKGIGWQEDEITVEVRLEYDAQGVLLSALQPGTTSDWKVTGFAQLGNSYGSTSIRSPPPFEACFDTDFSPIDSPLPPQAIITPHSLAPARTIDSTALLRVHVLRLPLLHVLERYRDLLEPLLSSSNVNFDTTSRTRSGSSRATTAN